MSTKNAFIYATDFDPDDPNDSHALVVNMIGEGKRVLELGCAEGSTTRILQSRGCQVTGIELDPDAARAAQQFAERVIVDDLETMDYESALGDARFDVVVAADVLEHLRDPRRCVVSSMSHLAPGGEFIMSIPNVAHGDVRLALASGDFDYREAGLLDDTHLRFFTRKSLLAFLQSCGLVEIEVRRVTRPLGGTELAPALESFDSFPDVMQRLETDPEAETYQFVLRAVPASSDSHLAAVAAERDALRMEVEQLRRSMRTAETYTVAHRRLLNLTCPDVLDSAIAGAAGSSPSEQVGQVEGAVRALIDERAERDRMEQAANRMREELDEIRGSETYRLGRVALAVPFFARRVLSKARQAWRRSGG